MLLGILIYVVGIPILEELATVIVQGLEVVKGWFVIVLTRLQDEVKNSQEKSSSHTRTIGFAIPTEDEDYEEENDEYDE